MIDILSIVDTKDNYSKFKDLIEKHTEDTDILRILRTIGSYYTSTGNDSIDWSLFETYFFATNPLIKSTKKAIFNTIFTKLNSGISTKSSLIDIFLQQYYAAKIATLALDIAEGKKNDLAVVQSHLDQYMRDSGKADTIGKEANRETLREIFTSTTYGKGLRWRLDALNIALGEIRKGNFILFGGRPDTGKTTLMLSEATHMVQQLDKDKQVLYFTNEEGARAVKPRMISSLLGVDHFKLLSDMDTYWDEYVHELGGNQDRILILEKSDMSVYDIEWWLNNSNPGLICIDQLRKVRGFEERSQGVYRLERLFQTAREWSKEYAPVMTVTQLDGEAENVQYPGMSRLYESKTAVQGEMDAIINIGRCDSIATPNSRFLNVVKNKLPTPDDPAMRNGKFEITLHPEIARFS
jgi:replicative DNA helicase